jgi:hypothetical protein
MSSLLHCNRKGLTSTVLVLWAFALFVGVANACSWDGVTAVPQPATHATHAVGEATDHDAVPVCDEFCSNDIPIVGVLKLVQDAPAGEPLVIATHETLGVLPSSARMSRLARSTHPPPDTSFFLRIVRLTL